MNTCFFLGGAYGDLTKHGRLPEFWGCPVDGLFRYMAIRPRRWSILRAELLDMAVFFSMSWVNIRVYCVYIYIIYNISYHIYIIYIYIIIYICVLICDPKVFSQFFFSGSSSRVLDSFSVNMIVFLLFFNLERKLFDPPKKASDGLKSHERLWMSVLFPTSGWQRQRSDSFSTLVSYFFSHIFGGLPSGKLRFSYGKSQFSMGKSTISMVIFNSYVSLPEGTSPAIGAFSNHYRGPLFPSAAGWTGPWHGLQWRGGFEDFSHGLFNPPKDGCLATYIRIYII